MVASKLYVKLDKDFQFIIIMLMILFLVVAKFKKWSFYFSNQIYQGDVKKIHDGGLQAS